MKKIISWISAAALVFVLFSACSDDFLDLSSPNQVSQDTFWKTEDDAMMALTACYDALQSKNLYDDDVNGWHFGFLMRETSTDNGDHTWGNWMLGSSISECRSATNEECFSMYWNANYELVKRCNILISNVEHCDMDEEKIAVLKAEAMSLRALAYCNLISVFRDVPYLTEPLTLAKAEASKTEKEIIATSVIEDLKKCIGQIPSVGSAGNGRMTREAAYAILGRIALFTGHYDVAIDAYKNIIGKVDLFVSGDGSNPSANFADLFKKENERASEVLLGVHFKGPGYGEGTTSGVCWAMPMNAIEASMNLSNDYYCTDGLPIDRSPLFKGHPASDFGEGAKLTETGDYDYDRYQNRDPRLKATLFCPGEYWNGTQWPQESGWFPASSGVCIRKWFTPEDTANEYDGTLDFYVIRYAEVLLSLSEAMIEKGGYSQTEITQYINQVRARVNMPAVEDVEGSGLSQEQLRAIVRHERRVELAFEDLRFADLYRWGEFPVAMQRMRDDKTRYGVGVMAWGTPRGAQDTVWPIPQGEIDTNLKLKQHSEWE